jgi:hypothetical protein
MDGGVLVDCILVEMRKNLARMRARSYLSQGLWVVILSIGLSGMLARGEKSQTVASAGKIAALVDDLADPVFKNREQATREIWQIGEAALKPLREVAGGKDPEQAHRARELVQRIELRLTPEMDAELVKDTCSFDKAPTAQKQKIFTKLVAKRAWYQILKLYAGVSSETVQERLQPTLERGQAGIDGIASVAIIGAREALEKGNPAGARELLELAPATAESLLALAEFHRSQGTLAADLKLAKTQKGEHAAAWQLALYRAAGDYAQAEISATAAGEGRLAALMAMMQGDPLPWLQTSAVGKGRAASYGDSFYRQLAARRWQDLPTADEPAAQELKKALEMPSSVDQQKAIDALFLLGEPVEAEKAAASKNADDMYLYYVKMERIPEALKLLGLDPEHPDYKGWVAGKIADYRKLEEEQTYEGGSLRQLCQLAALMEGYGQRKELEEAYLEPLVALAKLDDSKFALLARGLLSQGVSGLLRNTLVACAAENPGRFSELVRDLYSEVPNALKLFDWFEKLAPEATAIERYDAMLAVFGLSPGSQEVREKWQALAWDAFEKAEPVERAKLIMPLSLIVNASSDNRMKLRFWDLTPEADRDLSQNQFIFYDLSAAGRWDECARLFLKQIGSMSSRSGAPVSPVLHAYAAASLRKVGRLADAAAQDKLVDQLALGKEADDIAQAYAFGGDSPKATLWQARAVTQCDPSQRVGLARALTQHVNFLLEQKKWPELAAASEVLLQLNSMSESRLERRPVESLKLRFQADMAKALAKVATDRPAAIALLERALKFFPSDGNLADDFFPALRQVGLLAEHDAWFAQSWARCTAILAKYPDSENTLNTTAWLAARAQRNLDQATVYEQKALALHPNQSAYLDTMAEIHFAQGNRAKAIESSTRAIQYDPTVPGAFMESGYVLRRQNQRFRTGPLKK